MKIVIVGGGPGGLYFALLMKKRHPDYDVAVYERNRADDTFGFGVVFSDETLDNLMDYDAPSYQAITREFSYWDEIDFHFHGEVVRSTGHGFCGTERRTLLLVLHARCRELGVKLHFSHEVADLEEFKDADLIVAADGSIASSVNATKSISSRRSSCGAIISSGSGPARRRRLFPSTSRPTNSASGICAPTNTNRICAPG
jgi:2-polyprenyl-6-methoxyphenol hydroxylase-like FAD-dependent oxidoreductase